MASILRIENPHHFIQGILDALSFQRFFRVLRHAPKLKRQLYLRTLSFNLKFVFFHEVSYFTLFLGSNPPISVYMSQLASYPLLHWSFRVLGYLLFLSLGLCAMYYYIWSLVNIKSWIDWFAKICHKFLHANDTSSSNDSMISQVLIEKVFSITFFGIFPLQCFLVRQIPFIGPAINCVLLCWLCSLYCFDYKFDKWSIDQKLTWMEEQWEYFFGFGLIASLPFTLFALWFNFALCHAVWWLTFPMFVANAIGSESPISIPDEFRALAASRNPSSKGISLFSIPKKISQVIIKLLLDLLVIWNTKEASPS